VLVNMVGLYTGPGCIPCKLYARDTPRLTIDSIVICQTPRRRSPNFCERNAPWTQGAYTGGTCYTVCKGGGGLYYMQKYTLGARF
jgi:hypothetical protein